MRIVSLAPSNTEILFALGAGSDIVGRTAFCDYPPEALSVRKVGDWVEPDIERIRALEPDVILTSTVVQEKLAAKLRKEGLPVEHLSPTNLEGVFRSIYKLGQITGRLGEADALVQGMLLSFSELEAGAAAVSRPPRLYIEEWHAPPFVSGNWVPELAEIAGADYSLSEAGRLSREVSEEEVRRYDPELIILSICGVRLGPEVVLSREGWKGVSAIRAREVHVMDDSLLNRPGPRLVEGCRQLCSLVTSFSRRTAAGRPSSRAATRL
ncbi:MAG: cobalamin-binding protein [Candidatus Micrarchaeota archaeon]